MKADEIAVIIPCYNEEKSIVAVIDEVRSVLPSAQIYVFDNNSTDKSADLVRAKIAQLSQANSHLNSRLNSQTNSAQFSQVNSSHINGGGGGELHHLIAFYTIDHFLYNLYFSYIYINYYTCANSFVRIFCLMFYFCVFLLQASTLLNHFAQIFKFVFTTLLKKCKFVGLLLDKTTKFNPKEQTCKVKSRLSSSKR